MENNEMKALLNMELAPWIQKATALIEQQRKVGGNQFRHCLATMTILLDYHFVDSILLKAAIVHDLLEDSTKVTPEELAGIDAEGPEVLALVKELSRDRSTQTKIQYLEKLLTTSSPQAKIVKLADRISNLTDLHLFVFSRDEAEKYINETEAYILPMVGLLLESDISTFQKAMSEEMGKELLDLIVVRRTYVQEFDNYESIRVKIRNKLKNLPVKEDN